LTPADRLPAIAAIVGEKHPEIALGLFNGQNRSRLAVVVTTDGRRVHLPVQDGSLLDVSFLALLRSLGLGLAGLLGLITGSRREIGGTRRDERR
jgi:hypothetical protein